MTLCLTEFSVRASRISVKDMHILFAYRGILITSSTLQHNHHAPLSETTMTTNTKLTQLYINFKNSIEKTGNLSLVEIVFSDFKKLLTFSSLYRNFAFRAKV